VAEISKDEVRNQYRKSLSVGITASGLFIVTIFSTTWYLSKGIAERDSRLEIVERIVRTLPGEDFFRGGRYRKEDASGIEGRIEEGAGALRDLKVALTDTRERIIQIGEQIKGLKEIVLFRINLLESDLAKHKEIEGHDAVAERLKQLEKIRVGQR
jgi:hypothetical protein